MIDDVPKAPASSLPIADVPEVEPNDEEPQDLGVLYPPQVIGGSMSSCGSEGSWDGTDLDRLSFSVAEPLALRLLLQVEGGDLDLHLFDAEDRVLAVRDTAGLAAEEVTVSIGAGSIYEVLIRCWLGEEPSWALSIDEVSSR